MTYEREVVPWRTLARIERSRGVLRPTKPRSFGNQRNSSRSSKRGDQQRTANPRALYLTPRNVGATRCTDEHSMAYQDGLGRKIMRPTEREFLLSLSYRT